MSSQNGYTDYPNGVSSFGVPTLPSLSLEHIGSTVRNGSTNVQGSSHWWVNGNIGSTGNGGTSPNAPFGSMEQCFDVLNSGDIIHVNGNITEQLTTPAGIFDVTIVGEGNLPRNADAHTTSNGYSSATWKFPSSPTAATPLLKIQQQGWRIMNILFSGSLASTAAIQFFRDGGAGDAERDASHGQIIGCRFDGGVSAIELNGGPNFVQILNSAFRGFTGTTIRNVVGAGIGTNLNTVIQGNRFFSNVSHIILPLNQSTVSGNMMGVFTTTSISLTGGAGDNVVTQNYLSGTYSVAGGYVRAAASDQWAGNITPDAGVATAPWTLADPA